MNVSLSLNSYDWSLASSVFTYVPLVDSYSPELGPNRGGTNISVLGHGFVDDDARGRSSCVFQSGRAVAAHVAHSQMLFCTSPVALQDGLQAISIGVAVGGQHYGYSSSDTFYQHAEPLILRLSAASAPVTGRVFLTVFMQSIELPPGTPVYVQLSPATGDRLVFAQPPKQ